MIVLDRGKLKFLLAGRIITLDVNREYKKGRTYAVGLTHKKTVCRAELLRSTVTEDGWTVEIRQATLEAPRLLAANPAAQRTDYVTDPRKAARGEPEALTEAQVRDLTAYRAAHAHNANGRPLLDLRERILADLDEAMRTAISREDRAKLRAARHHVANAAAPRQERGV